MGLALAMDLALAMGLGTGHGLGHWPWAGVLAMGRSTDNALWVPTVFLATACVLGHRGPRAWAGPWGRGVARDNV